MYEQLLSKVRACMAHGDRVGALGALRLAIQDGKVVPRDGVELMLAVRRASQDVVMEAIDSVQWGMPGAYRYVPKADHAFA